MRTISLSAAAIACALALSPSQATAIPANAGKQASGPWLELRTALAGEDLWPGDAVAQAARPKAKTVLARGPSDHSLQSKVKDLSRRASDSEIPLLGKAKTPAVWED